MTNPKENTDLTRYGQLLAEIQKFGGIDKQRATELVNIIMPFTEKLVHQAREELSDKYYELLYAVGNKYEGETRHETALRYIKEAEKGGNPTAQFKELESKEEA